ncbi:protein kinase [Streptomyces sp. NPDC051014]|uniref:protein kinase n=1 Tax=Streptomyces sp. NPDC051014 TaxID=3155751 RepID=UPI0033EA756F
MNTDSPATEILPLIRQYTGPVRSIQPTERGFSSDLTALVDSEKGWFFVKAVRNRPGGRRDSILRERAINDYTSMVAPPLLWDVEDAWVVLGFEAVEARTASLAPGSPDVPRVLNLVHQVGQLPLPSVAEEWVETRWDRFTADSSEPSLFRGDSLLHTDINPDNFLIGKRHWVVDWAWPTRGAAFIDLALLVVQLIAAGHDAAQAERLAQQCPAWHRSEPGAVNAFAAAHLRMHWAFSERNPDAQWLKAMVEACQAWTDYRGIAVH